MTAPTPPAGPTPNQMPGAGAATGTPPAGAAPGAPPAAEVPPALTAPAAAEPPAAAAPPASTEPKPPWEVSGEAFDPARAWNLIQNVRGENDTLRGKLTAAQPILDAADQQRRDEQGAIATLTEDLTKANTRGDTWRNEAVRAKAEALAAAAQFQDPADAVTLVGDLSGFVDGDTIDAAKLAERITTLATEKPYLLGTPPPAGFKPNRGQGQSGNAPLTAAQVAAHAESQGDWKAAGLSKAQQLIDMKPAGF